jgi:formate dehydrogenase subunit gamma
MSATYERFSLRQRLEHIAMMTLFTILSVTGLPQKFFEATSSQWIMDALGGVDRARWFHRAAGIAFAVLAIVHVWGAVWEVVVNRSRLTMVPTKQDFRDAIRTLRFYLGVEPSPPRFDRFDYRQKFEYWGLIFGAIIVIATGIVLLYPVLAARWLPGEFIPASKVAHSNEGLLAFLVVIVWHIYNAHFSPDVFPFRHVDLHRTHQRGTHASRTPARTRAFGVTLVGAHGQCPSSLTSSSGSRCTASSPASASKG